MNGIHEVSGSISQGKAATDAAAAAGETEPDGVAYGVFHDVIHRTDITRLSSAMNVSISFFVL